MKSSCVLLSAVLALVSCAPAEANRNDELRSDLRSALSLASETDLLIGQIESGRMLQHFRTAHADYLREEAQRQEKEARDAGKGGNDANRFVLCAEQLELLSGELKIIRMQTDGATVAKARQHIEIIRKTLISAGAGR